MTDVTPELLAQLKADTLDNLRHDIAHIDDADDVARDLGEIRGYYLGRLTLLCALGVMDDDEYDDRMYELSKAIDAEREERGEA